MKTVLITGCSSGYGRETALYFLAKGWKVIATMRTPTADGFPQSEHLKVLALDVTQAESIKAALKEAGPIDVLVNNAGQSIAKPMLEQTEDDWDQIIDTNLKGCWLVGTELARALAAAGKPGSIVNIASILGERVGGAVGPYAISKAGLVQATKAMALELARYSIRVNAILPGYVATDMNSEFLASELGDKLRKRIPTRQFCELSDLTGPLLLLASNAGAGMTGACVAVDRGHLVSAL